MLEWLMEPKKNEEDPTQEVATTEAESPSNNTKAILCIQKPVFIPGGGSFEQLPGTSKAQHLILTYRPKSDKEPWGEHSVWPQPWQGKWNQIDDLLVELQIKKE